MHGLIMARQQCIDTSTESFSAHPQRAFVVWHGILIWWMYNDSGINSSCGWWSSLQGGDMPTHAIMYSKHKEREIKPDKKRILSTKQRLWLFVPLHESFLFSQEMMSRWKQMLLLLHAALVIACRMSCCHCAASLLNSWECVIFLNLTQHSQTQFTIRPEKQPSSAWLKLKLGTSQPPILTPHPNSNSAAKETPPKIWKKASDGGCFCVAHSLSLSVV